MITGATPGVGLQARRRLAHGGANIVMVWRNLKRAAAIRSATRDRWDVPIGIVIANFSRPDDVRSAADQVLTRRPAINVLIHCIGLHSTTPSLGDIREDGYRTRNRSKAGLDRPPPAKGV